MKKSELRQIIKEEIQQIISEQKKQKIWAYQTTGAYSRSDNISDKFKFLKSIGTSYTTGRDIGWGPSYVNTTVKLHQYYTGSVTSDELEKIQKISGTMIEIFLEKDEYIKHVNKVKERAKKFAKEMKKYK